MTKHHHFPSSISDNIHKTDCFQQTSSYHRNNHHHHNNNFIQYDELSKSIDRIPIRKQRNEYNYQINKKFSLITIYINNILLILIRLMILFLIILCFYLIFSNSIIYFYSKSNKNPWKNFIQWFYYQE